MLHIPFRDSGSEVGVVDVVIILTHLLSEQVYHPTICLSIPVLVVEVKVQSTIEQVPVHPQLTSDTFNIDG